MAFFKKKTEAEKTHQRALKELERVAKAQRKRAAKEHKTQQARLKKQNKEAKRQEKQARKQAKQAQREEQKSHQQAVKRAKKATKTRIRLARKAEKERRRSRSQARREAAGVAAPPFAKSAGCSVCGKKFGKTLHRRRHHCRQCRESCCLQCTSRTRRPVPQYGLQKPQKICVVCETLVNNESGAPREPAEAVVALAAATASRRAPAARRPHSAPLPPTSVVVDVSPTRRRSKSKGGSIWTLPIRPLLKRKKSAEQLRNRKMDMDLQMEKRALFGRAIEVQPQSVAPPAS
ncbi:Leukotriene A-4 hydrolase/aminopeptidase [Phytophthora megakarya]|uniref:Leukotriene A-4 hydrolase/aminopeptidase n=1 Tax=Phytophthora megakarya TaxID=4795 RepID=A0A225UNA2_9STRA|nr:Leukotriene A-4 hydrolase/aminopeptidase [Phytophthora megakarya]